MIKTTVDQNTFIKEFEYYNREDQFTNEGLKALHNYIENISEETGEDIELDVIALCCNYTEYTNLAEVQENYSNIDDLEDLENHTVVIEIPGTDRLIIENY